MGLCLIRTSWYLTKVLAPRAEFHWLRLLDASGIRHPKPITDTNSFFPSFNNCPNGFSVEYQNP